MLGWLRRRRSSESDGSAIHADPPMTPEEQQDYLLSAYLDDDLAPAERDDLEARLATHGDLRAALDGMRVVRDTLATLEVVRAPRSFAITAPPAPATRRFGRIDLVTRIGAMTAAVAFVAVLAGDLSGSSNDSTPIVDQAASGVALSSAGAAADADDGVLDAATAETLERLAVTTGSPTTDADAAGNLAPAATLDGIPTADLEAAAPPVLDAESTVEAAAASSELNATQEPTAPPAASGAAADDRPSDGGGDAAADSEEGSPSALPPNAGGAVDDPSDPPADPPAAAAPDTEPGPDAPPAPVEDLPQGATGDSDSGRDGSDAAAGTPAAEAALGLQSGATSAAAESPAGANALTEDGREVSSLAAALGAAAAALAAASGLLWWRRRGGATGPV